MRPAARTVASCATCRRCITTDRPTTPRGHRPTVHWVQGPEERRRPRGVAADAPLRARLAEPQFRNMIIVYTLCSHGIVYTDARRRMVRHQPPTCSLGSNLYPEASVIPIPKRSLNPNFDPMATGGASQVCRKHRRDARRTCSAASILAAKFLVNLDRGLWQEIWLLWLGATTSTASSPTFAPNLRRTLSQRARTHPALKPHCPAKNSYTATRGRD